MFPAKKSAVLQEIGQGCRSMVGGAKANCGRVELSIIFLRTVSFLLSFKCSFFPLLLLPQATRFVQKRKVVI